MSPTRLLAALFLSLILAASAFAQSTNEFGRASAGELDFVTKHPNRLSGSFDLGFGSGKIFGTTLGGTLLKDRMWFFASVEKSDPVFAAARLNTTAKMSTNLDERQNLTVNGSKLSMPLPSSFLSLHYTGVVSSNMFFSVTASRSDVSTTGPQSILVWH